MKTFLIGLVVGLIAIPICVYAYFATGSAPVATNGPAIPFEKTLASAALDAHIAKEMPKTAPVPADEPDFAAGAAVYRENCAVCHGLPGGTPTAIARGMFPKPPKLLEGTGVTDDPAGETYWKVSNGIRLSGMPGFSESLSQTQMWQVSLLLAHADKLPDSVKTALIVRRRWFLNKRHRRQRVFRRHRLPYRPNPDNGWRKTATTEVASGAGPPPRAAPSLHQFWRRIDSRKLLFRRKI